MVVSEPAAPALAPERVGRRPGRRIVVLRGALLVAVGALIVQSGVHSAASLALIVLFAASELVLAGLPARRIGGRWFLTWLGGADLLLVALGLLLAGQAMGPLWASALLMLLVVAL